MINAECRRCADTFSPDIRHVRIESTRYPPESKEEELGTMFDLCPDCSKSFDNWLAGEGAL